MENKHKQFKPFDRVLVRDINPYWSCDLYSHYNSDAGTHETSVLRRVEDKDILPYEGNEHLVGTTDEPEEEIKLEEGEWLIANDRVYLLEIGYGSLGKYIEVKGNIFVECSPFGGNGIKYDYAIRLKDFNPEDMEETSRHILCVKNGKVVRFHEKD